MGALKRGILAPDGLYVQATEVEGHLCSPSSELACCERLFSSCDLVPQSVVFVCVLFIVVIASLLIVVVPLLIVIASLLIAAA